MEIQTTLNYLNENYDPRKNITSSIMSIYEKTNILGSRIRQLENGAPTFLSREMLEDLNGNIRRIAEIELEQKKLPYIIVRKLPNDNIEYWKLNDLIIY